VEYSFLVPVEYNTCMQNASSSTRNPWQRLDALLLVILVVARIRIDTLAEAAVLPTRQEDVARHPWLGRLLSGEAMTTSRNSNSLTRLASC